MKIRIVRGGRGGRGELTCILDAGTLEHGEDISFDAAAARRRPRASSGSRFVNQSVCEFNSSQGGVAHPLCLEF